MAKTTFKVAVNESIVRENEELRLKIANMDSIISEMQNAVRVLWHEWDTDGPNWTKRVGNAAFRLAEMSGVKDPATEALPAPGYEEQTQVLLSACLRLILVTRHMPPLPRDLSHAVEDLEQAVIDYNANRGPAYED